MSLAGSCCEEQEAQEAQARARIRAATKWNEKNLMRGHLVRQEIYRALRCGDPCCDHVGCGECESESEDAPAAEKTPTIDGESDDDDDDFFDDDDDALMAKMRATRMGQMQAEGAAAARRQAARGVHSRLREGESLSSVLADRDDDSPIVLHVASAADEAGAEVSLWVEDALTKAAGNFPFARLMSEMCRSSEPPACLAALESLPALVVVERGIITSTLDGAIWSELRESQVRQHVSTWLDVQRVRFAAAAKRADDSDDEGDEEGEVLGYCGRPGCRTYFHEHVGPGTTFA